jgi:ABC-type multidrug transport system fused ATPase/permease subunit
MSLASELWSILTPPQRRQVLMAQAASLAMALSTVAGIAAIAPFFAVLGDPGLIDRNAALHWLYIECGQPGKRAFIAILGSAFIAVVVLGNLINASGSLIMTRLATRIGNELQTALFSDYLSRPYSFHASTNSATLVKNTVYESIRVTHGVLWNTLILVASLVTAASIVCASTLVNPAVTALAIAGLATGYGLIYLAVRNRVLHAGRALSRLTGEQVQTVVEGFGAIKELILLQTAGFFRSRLEQLSKATAAAAAHNELVSQSPRPLVECVAAGGLVGVALVLAGRDEGVGPWLGQLTFLAFAVFRLLAGSSLRLSVGRFTGAAEVDLAAAAITREVTRLRELSPASGVAQVLELAAEDEGGTVLSGEAGGPRAETWVRFHLLVEGDTVKDARVQAFGCPHTLDVAGWLCQELKGRAREALPPGAPADWAASRSVPVEKLGRLLVIEDALRACLLQWP